MAPGSSWAEATAVKQLSSHIYEAQFPDDFCIGSVPHGGFVTGVFLRVASVHFNTTLSSQAQPHTLALHLEFLRRTQTGPATFTVQDTKLGRQTSIVHITLSQGGREEVVGYLTNSNMTTESGITFDSGFKLYPEPVPVNLSLLRKDQDPHWFHLPSAPFPEFRRAAAKIQFHYPRAGLRREGAADEWIRLSTGEKWSNTSLAFAVDMFPMPAEEYFRREDVKHGHNEKSSKFWYPTLLLNMDIKKLLPEEGVEWLFLRAITKQVKNGRMDIDITIADEHGEIVALSHHIAFAVDVSRNLAERKANTKL